MSMEMLNAASLYRLQLTINNCARFVYKERQDNHITNYAVNVVGSNLRALMEMRNFVICLTLI